MEQRQINPNDLAIFRQLEIDSDNLSMFWSSPATTSAERIQADIKMGEIQVALIAHEEDVRKREGLKETDEIDRVTGFITER